MDPSPALSSIGKACLIAREGRRLTAYADGVGVLTIGIGCTRIDGKPVPRGLRITAAECDALFEATWPCYAAAVADAGPADLADHQADALISFCYNIGTAGFAGSTIARLLKAGNLGAVPGAMLMWGKPVAIVTRRQAEADQFATPYTAALPRPTSTARPIAVPLPAKAALPAAPAGRTLHPAQAAPVLVPLAVPSTHPWLDAFGAWVDRVFAPSGAAPDGTARR
jgi:lysozyme